MKSTLPPAADRLRLPPGVSGALVVRVAGDSPAERAGLNGREIIMTISRRAVRSAGETRRELARARTGEPVFVLLWRRGAELFLQMRRD
jgi:S1-C subfamily serine protease